jgi:prolipoprotein diacylglyceryltransferase
MPLLTTLHWSVPTSAGFDFYTLFYILAMALNLGLLVGEGRRRGYPLRPWLVMLACTTLAFIVGTKLLALSGPEWEQLLSTGRWPLAGARTVLGGSAAVMLTLLALRRPFGFSWHVFDAFALPLCAALTVQCVGCLLAGCCFGEVTPGGWGLTYSPGTLPYLVQAYQGLIPAGAAHSLPVHPTQLYTLLLCAAVGMVVWLTRHRPWPVGSRYFLHLGLLLAGRFLIEFWREPAGEPLWNTSFSAAGLTMLGLQWVVLPLIPLLLGAWFWLVGRPGSFGRRPPESAPTQNPTRNLVLVAALLGATAALGGSALTEVLVVKTVLLVVLMLEGGTLLLGAADAHRPARVALPLGLAGTVLLLTSQAPADSARASLELSVGQGQGAYFEDIRTEGGSGSCSGSPTHKTYDHRYALRGGSLELHRPGKEIGTYGVGIWQGTERITYQTLDPVTDAVLSQSDSTKPLLSINPYIECNLAPIGRFGVGYRAGLHLGNLVHYTRKDSSPFTAANLDAGLWLGFRDVVFAQVDLNRGPSGLGNYTSRFGLGSGLGHLDGSTVLAGVADSHNFSSQRMGFFSADIKVGNTGFRIYPYGATNFRRHNQMSLRVSYRLPVGKRQ